MSVKKNETVEMAVGFICHCLCALVLVRFKYTGCQPNQGSDGDTYAIA
jgi:hypothetical protein